jgi:hypothetical protein
MSRDDPSNKVVWFRVRGWDRTIPVLSPVIPQNWRDERRRQRTSLSWLSRNQTHPGDLTRPTSVQLIILTLKHALYTIVLNLLETLLCTFVLKPNSHLVCRPRSSILYIYRDVLSHPHIHVK